MDIPLRVLIIEDSDRDVALEVRALKAAGYQVTYAAADTAAAMEAALNKQAFDIVISDNDMPQFDAQGALAVLKQSGLDIPFIIVSGSIDEELAVALMRAGAHDYVMKDRLTRLVPAVQRELREAELRRERKQAEEAQVRLVAMLDATPGFVGYADAKDTHILYINAAGRKMVGVQAQEDVTHLKIADVHPEWTNKLFRDEIIPTAIRDGLWTGECAFLNRDGHEIPVMMALLAHKSPSGEVERFSTVSIDITDRKQAEEEMRESVERLRDIMFSIADWVWEVDENGAYTYSSQKGIDLFGESRGDIVGKTPFDFMPPDEAKRVAALFSEIVAKKAPIKDLENWNIGRNGERICFLTNGVPILDEEGNLKGYRGVDKDITDSKKAEARLKETLESLRRAVNTTIRVMVSAVETRDPYTSGHQVRSANLARAIATELGLPPEKIEGIRMAGSIHDIGKLSIPAEILSKPTKLSAIELLLIKEHANRGYEILKDVESPWPLAEIVHQHHERMDGSGYPRNLKGEGICIEARVLTVADVVEAMASHRPYRPGLGIDAALEEIEKNKGILYDGTVADACLRLFREKGFKLDTS